MATGEAPSVGEVVKRFDRLGNIQGEGLPLIKCHGFNLPVPIVVNWLDIDGFPFTKDDVLIQSHPKSGTHWVWYISYLLKTKNFGDIPDIFQRPMLDIPYLPGQLQKLAEAPSPRVVTTHLGMPLLPRAAFDAKVIYVHRNAKDVCVSAYHHYINHRAWPYDKSFLEFVPQFIRGDTFWGPYPKHIQELAKFLKEEPEKAKNLLVLRYEDMKRDLAGSIRKIAKFLEVDVDDDFVAKVEQAARADNMRNNKMANGHLWRVGSGWREDADFVRVHSSNGWRDYFTDEKILAEFNAWVRASVPKEFECIADD